MSECAFCTNTADTGEHIWSNWINRVLPKTTGFWISEETSTGEIRQYKQAALDTKFPVLCHSCNNEWLSDLENEQAKPAMQDLIASDNGIFLSTQRIKSIVNFAFKCAVIADHAPDPLFTRSQPFFTVAERTEFKNSFAIPSGVRVWLAAFKKEGHGVFRAMYHKSPSNAVGDFDFYVLTFGAGFLIFQLLAFRWTSKKFPPLGVKQDKFWERFSIPIWPNDGREVFWPPDKQLMPRMAVRFWDRWRGTILPDNWF